MSYTEKVKAFVAKHPGLTRQQVIEAYMKIGSHYGTIASAIHRLVKKRALIEEKGGGLRVMSDEDDQNHMKNLIEDLSKAEQFRAGPRTFIDAKFAEKAKELL